MRMNYYSTSRGGFLSNIPQVTRFILVTNVVLFLLTKLIGEVIYNYLGLFSIHTGGFKSYQLISHMFMHGSFGHIFFNMFGLYIFGRVLESYLGSQRFFILYFVSGLGAAGLQLLIYYYKMEPALMIGASGAVFGILAAFAVMFPNVELFMFLIPIPIKAKYLVPLYAVVELVFGVTNFDASNIAHFAHLGGALFGFLLTFFWKKNQFRQY